MNNEGLTHPGYHRVSVSFIFSDVTDSVLANIAADFGAKFYGRRNKECFFEFDKHPIDFLKSLDSSGLTKEYFLEGEPFDFRI